MHNIDFQTSLLKIIAVAMNIKITRYRKTRMCAADIGSGLYMGLNQYNDKFVREGCLLTDYFGSLKGT